MLAPPELSDSTNVSMFFRSASMIGAMLPLTSMRNTTSATPLVFVRVCGAAAGAAFDALGSPKLKQYFQDNIAVATALPTNGVKKISAA